MSYERFCERRCKDFSKRARKRGCKMSYERFCERRCKDFSRRSRRGDAKCLMNAFAKDGAKIFRGDRRHRDLFKSQITYFRSCDRVYKQDNILINSVYVQMRDQVSITVKGTSVVEVSYELPISFCSSCKSVSCGGVSTSCLREVKVS